MKHILFAVCLILAGWLAVSYIPEPAPEIASAADIPGSTGTCIGERSADAGAPTQHRRALRKMVAGLLVTGFEGDSPSHPRFSDFAGFAGTYQLGGVIFLRRNVRSFRDVRALNAALRETLDRPFIMIDEEGGAVSRLRGLPAFPTVPAAREVARTMHPEQAEQAYRTLGRKLSRLGFNVNLGPVVDLDRNARNPVIGQRSYSASAAKVVEYARSFSSAHAGTGVMTALKHFPGHGSSDTDTHREAADITRTWHPDELVPFMQLIAEGKAPMIMTSHVTLAVPMLGQKVREIATFSPSVVSYLRDVLCHDGLIVTDDMTMAAADRRPLAAGIEAALRAGHDIVIIAAPSWIGIDALREAIDTVVERAAADPELAAAIKAAHGRIVDFKRRQFATSVPSG